MITRTLDRSLDDARILVKGAFELLDGVETYHEDDRGVVTGKTGFRLGLIASSYGESVVVDLRPVDPGTTEVTVRGERNVAVNVGANPDRYVLEYVRTLETLAEYPTADVVELLAEETRAHTKEVDSERDQTDGAVLLAVVLALLLLLPLLWIVI